MSVDELVRMNDKSRKQAYRHGLGAGVCMFLTLFMTVYLIEAFHALPG